MVGWLSVVELVVGGGVAECGGVGRYVVETWESMGGGVEWMAEFLL